MSPIAPVTVIVPAFNAAPYLQVTLRSLQQQTVRPEAVVVIDDGSTDDSAAIAAREGATVVRQAHKGPAAARNRGLELATTEFVAFLDADDWYGPDKLERSLTSLDELQAQCIATESWSVRGDCIEGRRNQRRVVPGVVTLELLLRGNPVVTSSVVARRKAVLDVGRFDEDPELIASEDYDLWLRLAQKEPIAYLTQPLTFCRTHTASMTEKTLFLRGVDRILERVAHQYEGEAHFQNLVRRRRADVRLDLASDLLADGGHAQARQLIDEAAGLARTWRGVKLRMRTLLHR
ncbi:MAG: glycosyltransferase family 2 protein [Planctomycetes bacterium]|nr:glycosyltransferase family 2 protein [Planctomycetota bacterium]